MLNVIDNAWWSVVTIAKMIFITITVWLGTIQTMLAIVILTVVFDLDPWLAEWCSDVMEAVMAAESHEDFMENARLVWGERE